MREIEDASQVLSCAGPGSARSIKISQSTVDDRSVRREREETRVACNDIIMRVLLSSLALHVTLVGWARLNTGDYPGNINNGGDSRGDTAVITIT